MKNSEPVPNLLANHESHQERPPKSVSEPPEQSRYDPIRRMSESFEVVDGGTSVVAAPVEEGGGETSPKDVPLGPERLTLK